MKQDVKIIKSEILDQKKEREQNQKLKELKTLCKDLCYTTIRTNFKKGVSLEKIYLQRDEIVKEMLKDINNQTTKTEDKTTFKTKIIERKVFDFPIYQIENLLNQIFIVEYKKEELQQKKENNIIKKELKEKLKNEFITEIEEIDSPTYATIAILAYEHNKKDIIEEIAESEKEKEILNEIYLKTLSEVKKDYSEQIKAEKQKVKQPKEQNLHWTWKGYFILKAFNTIKKKGL